MQRIQAETVLACLGDTFRILTIPCLPARKFGAVIGLRTACFYRICNTFIVFDMGVYLASRGLAYAFFTNARLGIVKGIAVDRSGRLSIGTGRCAVQLTRAFVGEMISGGTGRNHARTVLANARRGMVCCVTVQALRAAMLILVDTGIVQKAFVAGACVDNTLPFLTKLIGLAFHVTFAAVQRIALELFFGQT